MRLGEGVADADASPAGGLTVEPVRLFLEPVTPAAARASLAELPPAERERVEWIVRPARADAVAVSLALARRALAAAAGLPPGELRFDRTCARCGDPTHGRPRLVPELVQFSVARSERWAAVAVAPVVVGVDVEDAGRAVTAGDIAAVLSPDELRRPNEDVLGLWVMKEAVGKAMGMGVVGAESFSIAAGGAGWRAVDDASDARWSVTRVDVPDAALAVAVGGEPRPIRLVPLSGCRAVRA
jgi:4'-phosphopantetheinyl transferase